MFPIDSFFQSLSSQRAALGTSKPVLGVKQHRAFKSCYLLLQEKDASSPQTFSRHENARQHLRNAKSLGLAVFLLCALSATITQLASIKHNDLFPRLEIWTQQQPSLQKIEELACDLITEFDHEINTNGKAVTPEKRRTPMHRSPDRRQEENREPSQTQSSPLHPSRSVEAHLSSSSKGPDNLQNYWAYPVKNIILLQTDFRKAIAHDDSGLEREVKELLGGREVALDTEEYDVSKRFVDYKTACAVLIHENGPPGVVHTLVRDGVSKVNILPTGPQADKGFRIVIFQEEQACLFFGRPSIRCFRLRSG